MWTADKDMNMKAILLNFFQALFFTTSEVVFITTKIVFIFMSLTAVHIYSQGSYMLINSES